MKLAKHQALPSCPECVLNGASLTTNLNDIKGISIITTIAITSKQRSCHSKNRPSGDGSSNACLWEHIPAMAASDTKS